MSKINYAKMPKVRVEPFTITGIMVNEPFYFVAGQMHRQLGLDFERVQSFTFYNDDEQKVFPNATYLFFDADNWLLYILMQNDVPIVKQLKNSDVLLFVVGRDCLEKTKELNKDLRKQSSIRYCKQYYYSQQKNEQTQENVDADIPKTVQLEAFSQKKNSGYKSIKEKRRKVVKNIVIDNDVIESLKEELEYNLCYEPMLL